jgi:hypothetical protein
MNVSTGIKRDTITTRFLCRTKRKLLSNHTHRDAKVPVVMAVVMMVIVVVAAVNG